MRKVFFIVLVSALFLSCTKETIIYQGADVNTYYFDVYPHQWKTWGDYDHVGYYCYAEGNLNAITNSVIESGGVFAYVIIDNYDRILPDIEPFFDNGYFSRVIRYDLLRGKITFIIEDSDFKTPFPPVNGKLTFKVIVLSKR